jgi:hypothetical protein
VVSISGHPFETVDQQFTQRANIFIGLGKDTNLSTLGDEIGLGTVPVDFISVTAETGRSFQCITFGDSFFHQLNKTIIIEVGIGNCCKQPLGNKQPDRLIQFALFFCFGCNNGQPFQGENQQILKLGGIFFFATNTDSSTTGTLCRFLTLKS